VCVCVCVCVCVHGVACVNVTCAALLSLRNLALNPKSQTINPKP
jgi:hypothetical protein